LLSVAASAVTQPLILGIQFRRSVSRYVWISVFTAASAGVLGFVLVALLERGLTGVLEAQLASQLLLLGLAARETMIAGRPRTDRSAARQLLRHGLPLVPSFFFLMVLLQGNQFLLKDLRGLEELGVYIVGYNLGVVMSLVVSGFTTAWLPFFLSFSRDPAAGLEQLRRAMTYYVIGLGSATLLFFAWARPVVGVLAASTYEQAHIVVGYSAAAYFLVGVFSVLLPPLYYAREVWAVTLIQAVGALAAVCLQLALIARFGVLGAGIGLTGGFLILCLLLFGWLRVHRGRYLVIRYDWPRVLGFGSVIVLGAAVFSLPARTAPLEAVGWSAAASAVILGCAWTALRSDERRVVAAAVRAVVSR
jgi:O-antigen/teichoic acid export membrane protein